MLHIDGNEVEVIMDCYKLSNNSSMFTSTKVNISFIVLEAICLFAN